MTTASSATETSPTGSIPLEGTGEPTAAASPDFSLQDAGSLRAAYEASPAQLLASPWTYAWWRHGGEPGPDWLSDKVELVAESGQFGAHYLRTRNAPVPPFASTAEELTGSVSTGAVEQLLSSLVKTRFFERTWPSESRQGLRGALIYEIELLMGGQRLRKVLYEPAPEELGSLSAAHDAITTELERTGARRSVQTQPAP